ANITYKVKGRVKEVETLEPYYIAQVITPSDSIKTAIELSLRKDEDPGKIRISVDNFETVVDLESLVNIPNLGFVRFIKNPDFFDVRDDKSALPLLKVLIVPPASRTNAMLSALN